METTAPAGGIWVLAQRQGDGLAPASRRLLAAARSLADQGGLPVTALLLDGSAAAPPGPEAIAYGADRVLHLSDPHLAATSAPHHTAALVALAGQHGPAIVLLADDAVGRDLAPRLAQALGGGLLSAIDPTTLEVDAYSRAPSGTRRRWDGRLVTTYVGSGSGPTVITLAGGAALEPYSDDWRSGETEAVDLAALGVAWPEGLDLDIMPDAALPAPAPDWHPQIAAWRALRAARVLVLGGPDLGSAAAFALLPRLAAVLGGEWGATHAAVEAGWAPPERTVGLRGVQLRPDLVVACGVHGSPEDVVAFQQARLIVAVHPDPTAPLFRWATWSVVAPPALFVEQLLTRLDQG